MIVKFANEEADIRLLSFGRVVFIEIHGKMIPFHVLGFDHNTPDVFDVIIGTGNLMSPTDVIYTKPIHIYL